MSEKFVIPSLKQVKKVIEEFKVEDWDELDYTQVHKYVGKLDAFFDQQLGFRIRTVAPVNTNQLLEKVYRVRQFNEKINPWMIAEFSNPPVNLTKKIQRANLPYHPVFYGAPDARTALIETLEYNYKDGEDNIYYLSEWSFNKDQSAFVTMFVFGEYNVDNTVFIKFRDKTFNYIKSQFGNITVDETESLKQIFMLFSNLFEKKDSHALSGYIGHMHLYANKFPRTDIFIYPSIQSEKYEFNYAIHPNAVLHLLQLSHVYLIRVYKYKIDRELRHVTLHAGYQNMLGTNREGFLEWTALTDEAHAHLKKIFPEFDIEKNHSI